MGEADVIEAKDKAAKGGKKAEQGGKAEGGKHEKKEQEEKVPAEIPQVRWWGLGVWEAGGMWGGSRLGLMTADVSAPECGSAFVLLPAFV